jgi:hypothetical protein
MILLNLKVMKKLLYTTILALLLSGGSAMRAQDMPDEYLGLPGDNLNLYAVMKLFQESETLEGFKSKLNDENSRINNLDLNGDNMVDYITVSDYVDGNVHTIVLRTALSRQESQDIAVFTVEKLGNGQVHIQLIGDEALYGKNYVIEPNYAETPNPGYLGNTSAVTVVTTTYYDVAAWPVVRFIFLPGYMVWRSCWYWDYYPVYWHPWHPWFWHYYYGYHYHWYPNYYRYYHHTHYCHYAYYHNHYYNHIRTYSPVVTAGIKEGRYKSTYSRPDQRREGEALYTRTNPARDIRTQAGTSTATGNRRTTAQPVQGTRTGANGTGTERKPTNYIAERDRTGSSAVQNNTSDRRSTTTSTGRPTTARTPEQRVTNTRTQAPSSGNRSDVSHSSTQRATTAQRSATPAVRKPAASPSVSQRSATTRSSSSSVSQRTSPKPSTSVQRTAPAKSHGSSAPKTISRGSSGNSSSHAGKSVSAVSRGSSGKASASGSSNRR